AIIVNECKSFLAAERQYTLKEDIILDTGTPNLANGTLVSVVSIKYKDYNLPKPVTPPEDNNNLSNANINTNNINGSSSNSERVANVINIGNENDDSDELPTIATLDSDKLQQ